MSRTMAQSQPMAQSAGGKIKQNMIFLVLITSSSSKSLKKSVHMQGLTIAIAAPQTM